MLSQKERLEKFLAQRFDPAEIKIEQLTADASTREYFRINWKQPATAIACVYPAQNDPQEESYLDVTRLFLSSGLPVAEILAVDPELAIIVHEDFGDRVLRGMLESASSEERDQWFDRSIELIAKIQAATDKAFEL